MASLTIERENAEIIASFLEVAVHTILYTRGIYPKNLFEQRKEYEIAVYMSRHPELNQYIHHTLMEALPLITNDCIDIISVVILSETGEAIEKYTFHIDIMAPSSFRATYEELRQMLAAAIQKLTQQSGYLPALPVNTSFTLLFHTAHPEKIHSRSMESDAFWSRVEPTDPELRLDQEILAQNKDNTFHAKTRILKSIHAGRLRMQCFVQRPP